MLHVWILRVPCSLSTEACVGVGGVGMGDGGFMLFNSSYCKSHSSSEESDSAEETFCCMDIVRRSSVSSSTTRLPVVVECKGMLLKLLVPSSVQHLIDFSRALCDCKEMNI